MLKTYTYKNTMTGQEEEVVYDTETNRDVKTFVWPFAKLRAQLYIKLHSTKSS